MPMFDAYVFDLDGTLLDTLDDLTSAVNAALSAYHCPQRTRDEVQSFVGNGIKLLMRRAVPDGEADPRFSDIFEYFKRYYGAHCFDSTKPYPGVMELLTRLKDAGKRTAIVSNKADYAVKLLTERFFSGLVGAAAGENEAAGIRKKPAPDSVFAALDRLGADKSAAVYVGDSEVDIQTAANARIPCISVTWGFKSREFLLQNGASCLVDTPAEILKF